MATPRRHLLPLLLLAMIACNPLASGPQPSDATLRRRLKAQAPRWRELLTRLSGHEHAYLSLDDPRAVADAEPELAALARDLGLDSLTYVESADGSRELVARVWSSGLVTGGASKGLVYRRGDAYDPLLPVASCDGRAPWPGCSEHDTCVVPIAGHPGWSVFCDYDL